jgi:hypothetical protein
VNRVLLEVWERGPFRKLCVVPVVRDRSPGFQDIGYDAHRGPNLSKPCVACTFEFLISASPYLKLTTSGISLGGQAVKHRQLARQVGVRIEDPPVNSMASFKFTSAVPPQGTTFVFGSWVCITDGVGNFHRFIIDMKQKTLAASFHSDLDEFVDNLNDSSTHGSATRTEEGSVFDSTPSSAATTLLGLDLFQFEDLRSRSRFGLLDSAIEPQEANNPESLFALEKDLDYLLRIGKPEAIARRGAAGCLGHNGLMITSTPEGRFVHWEGMKLSNLLEDEDRLVAHLEPLPFQEGRPLATMAEESTELVKVSSGELISRQVLMAEEGEDDGNLPIIELDMISENEATANTGDKNDTDHEARRARNRARVVRRRRVGGSTSACNLCIVS